MTFALLLPIACSRIASAEVLTFDDITTAVLATVPNGYGGLNFSHFLVLDPALDTGLPAYNGYANGTVSGSYVALNSGGGPASFASDDTGTFTLDSFDLTAVYNDNLNVLVTGSLNGVVVDSENFVVSPAGPTLETLDWTGIDTVNFSPSGGTTDPRVGIEGPWFALDNVTVTDLSSPATAPEPSSLLLLGTGLAAMFGFARRRLRVA